MEISLKERESLRYFYGIDKEYAYIYSNWFHHNDIFKFILPFSDQIRVPFFMGLKEDDQVPTVYIVDNDVSDGMEPFQEFGPISAFLSKLSFPPEEGKYLQSMEVNPEEWRYFFKVDGEEVSVESGKGLEVLIRIPISLNHQAMAKQFMIAQGHPGRLEELLRHDGKMLEWGTDAESPSIYDVIDILDYWFDSSEERLSRLKHIRNWDTWRAYS